MKVLIVYGSTEGQTKKICEYLKQQAQNAGHSVSLNDTRETPLPPEGFDAVVIGASVHAGNYQTSVEHYIKEHQKTLNAMTGIFVSVSLAAAHDEPESREELKKITEDFLNKTAWHPTIVEQVAGALRYTKYNFLKKYIMRLIAQRSGGSTDTSEDHEYTDWSQVKRIIQKLEKASEAVSK